MGHKRRIYLVNPKFQLKFSLYVCLLMFISSIIYPISIYDIMTTCINGLTEKFPELSKAYVEKRQALVIVLCLWQLGFTALSFIICIFFSHKIAGPLYKLKKFIINIREDKTQDKLYFRKGDYFPEMADEFNDSISHIRKNYKKANIYLNEVNSYLNKVSENISEDKKIFINEISKKLIELQKLIN